MADDTWPSLRFADWKDTCETLHLWTQVVGKTRLALEPSVNHWWHVPLYVSARGLATSAMPYGTGRVNIEFDFIDHRLRASRSDGRRDELALAPQTVRDFYSSYRRLLDRLGVQVSIWSVPVEIPDAIPFEDDVRHAAYDAESVHRFWRVLMHADRVLRQFRGRFIGKASPVHFFWGSFDLAVTRFSGRPAPPHPGGVPNLEDWVVREAYSHEVSSCGFWPGSTAMGDAAFYSYAYPEPAAFSTHRLDVPGARYDTTLREFLLPYESLRQQAEPDAVLLAFLQQSYQAAAVSGGWDRAALEVAGTTRSPR